MAAIAHPHPDPAPERHRPDLRLVPPPRPERRAAPRRPSARQHAVHQRRRLAVAVGVVLLVVLVRWGAGVVSGPAEVPAAPSARTVLAQPGDTYWSLAERFGGAGDIRAQVDLLVAANGGADLAAGDRIVLPSALFEG